MRLVAASFLVTSILGLASTAHAERPEGGFTFSGDLYGGYLLHPPALTDIDTPKNQPFTGLTGTTLRPDDTAVLVGFGVHVGYTPVKFPLITFPILGFRLAYPGAANFRLDIPDPTSTQNGRLRLSNDSYMEFLLPGVGISQNLGKNWKFSVTAQPDVSVFRTSGTLTQGLLAVDLNATGYGLGLSTDASICGSVGGSSSSKTRLWACPYVSPVVIMSNPDRLWNSVTFGIRLEITGH